MSANTSGRNMPYTFTIWVNVIYFSFWLNFEINEITVLLVLYKLLVSCDFGRKTIWNVYQLEKYFRILHCLDVSHRVDWIHYSNMQPFLCREQPSFVSRWNFKSLEKDYHHESILGKHMENDGNRAWTKTWLTV